MSKIKNDLSDREIVELFADYLTDSGRWQLWLSELFPAAFSHSPAQHHIDFWDWVDEVAHSKPQSPLVWVLPRGGGKTQSAEAAAVRVGVVGQRKFVLYVRSTQVRANESIRNIAGLMETPKMALLYPRMSDRLIGKFGYSKGWSMTQARALSGFSVVGLGLDTAVRGVKLDEFRPDLIILDDIDDKDDSEATIDKKVSTITKSILPAAASDACVLVVQNLIHANSIVSSLVDRSIHGADWLANRRVIGPIPAIEDLSVEPQQQADGTIRHIITGGTPTWPGQSLEVCQKQIDDWGIRAFREESQHEVREDKENALWTREIIDRTRVAAAPMVYRVCVGVDPQSSTGQTGVIVGAVAKVNGLDHFYVIADATPPAGVSPDQWGLAVVAAYTTHEADLCAVEVNHGGDMVKATIQNVSGGLALNIKDVRASRGKFTRAEPIAALWGEGRGHMLGYFPDLEDELCSWVPGDDSPNRLDAMVWSATVLVKSATGGIHKMKSKTTAYSNGHRRRQRVTTYG